MRGIYIQARSPYYWLRYYDKTEPDLNKRRKSICTKIFISESDLSHSKKSNKNNRKVKLKGTPELLQFLDAFKRGLNEMFVAYKTGIKLNYQKTFNTGYSDFIYFHSVPNSKDELKQKTINLYNFAANLFIKACSDKPLVDYTEKDYIKFLYYLNENNLSQNTKSIYNRHLKAIWSFFVNKNYCKTNIVSTIPANHKDPEPIPNDDLQTILNHLRSHTDNIYQYHLIMFLLLTGCRPSSAMVQTAENIDYNNNVIKIVNVKTGKRKGREYYNFPLYSSLRNLLQDINVKSGRLFHQFNINQLDYTSSLKFWQRAQTTLFNKNQISRKYTLKQLRPTFASYCINILQMDIYTVQKLLDHSDIKVTNQHYILHDMNNAKNKLDSFSTF